METIDKFRDIEMYESNKVVSNIVNNFIKNRQQKEFTSDEKSEIDNVLNDFFKSDVVDWERDVVFEIDNDKQLKTIDNYYYGKTINLFKYDDMFIYQTIHDDFEISLLITDDIKKIINELDMNFYYDFECIKLQN